jgi:proteic killer suppression protein
MIWYGEHTKGLPTEIQIQARKKLRMVNNALTIDDLKAPPGNRLEALKGDRKGQWSIRINDQWRLCFYWKGTNATLLEIVDYH